jgi:hypothetical protein
MDGEEEGSQRARADHRQVEETIYELYHRPQIPQPFMEGYQGGRASARSRMRLVSRVKQADTKYGGGPRHTITTITRL